MDIYGHSVASFLAIVSALLLQGCHAADTYPNDKPILTWPLGEGINHHELLTQSWAGSTTNVQYAAGPATLDYTALLFTASSGSYVDLPVPYMAALDGQDYSITFHMYAVSDGVLLHFRTSTNGSSPGISEIKIEAISGSFVTKIYHSDGSSSMRTFGNMIDYNTWLHVIFERDNSNAKVKIYRDESSVQEDFDWWVANIVTLLPGTIRLGGSLDGGRHFTGRLTCLHFIGTKKPTPTVSYDSECTTPHWPPLTSSTTSTTSTTTSTPTTTTTTPTTTSTTTTTTPAPTSTTATTTATASTTTTPAPAISTTSSPTPSITTTATTSTPTSATSPAASTSTTPPPTTTSAPRFNPAIPYISTEPVWNHFAATAQNATFQFTGDILGKTLKAMSECVWLCAHNRACGTIVLSGVGECLIGVPSPVLKYDFGSTVYTSVETLAGGW